MAGEREREDAERWLRFDEVDVTDRLDIERLRYVVLGKSGGDWDSDLDECTYCYYVLVVRPLEGGSDKEYERVGAGSLRMRDLSSEFERVYVL